MRALTKEGRKLMDEIEGFEMFLTVTENNRLNILNSPEKTPHLFEKYLPYAVALGVEHKWADQFSKMFKSITESGNEYRPHWYVGSSWNSLHVANFADSFGNSLSIDNTSELISLNRTLLINEQATDNWTPTIGSGALWLRSTDNNLIFTDESGTDYILSSALPNNFITSSATVNTTNETVID